MYTMKFFIKVLSKKFQNEMHFLKKLFAPFLNFNSALPFNKTQNLLKC